MNILDADHYRINVKDIDNFAKDKTPAERVKDVGMIAVATSVPVIMVCVYLRELYGDSDELIELQDKLMQFYQVDTVSNTTKLDPKMYKIANQVMEQYKNTFRLLAENGD